MSSVSLKLDVSFLKQLNEVPDMPVIVLLANDGKITANRMSLRLASPTIHAQLLENPDLAVLDMKNCCVFIFFLHKMKENLSGIAEI